MCFGLATIVPVGTYCLNILVNKVLFFPLSASLNNKLYCHSPYRSLNKNFLKAPF